MPAPEYVSAQGPGVWRIEVWVLPGGKRDEIEGIYQGRLKLRLRAPAVDNKANKALVGYLAAVLGLKKNQVRLVGGEKNRRKTLRVESAKEISWPVAASVNP